MDMSSKGGAPSKGRQQERRIVCVACKGENHIARNCDNYWRWKERDLEEEVKRLRKQKIEELTRKVKELRETKEKAQGEERVVRRTMRPLRAVWMKVGLEKVETHEGVTVDVLLDSGATGLFMNREFVDKNGFRMEKLERPVKVMNVDGTHNKGENITHEVMCNIFYKGHRERARFDVCNLGRTEVILGMPWLAAHNPEIDWECYDSELLTRSNCDRSSRQPCILSSPPVRGSG